MMTPDATNAFLIHFKTRDGAADPFLLFFGRAAIEFEKDKF